MRAQIMLSNERSGQQTQFLPAPDGLGPTPHLKFVECADTVRLDGVLGDEELSGDLTIAEATGNERQDLKLACRDADPLLLNRVGAKWRGGRPGYRHLLHHDGFPDDFAPACHAQAQPDPEGGEEGGDERAIELDRVLDDDETVFSILERHNQDPADQAEYEDMARHSLGRGVYRPRLGRATPERTGRCAGAKPPGARTSRRFLLFLVSRFVTQSREAEHPVGAQFMTATDHCDHSPAGVGTPMLRSCVLLLAAFLALLVTEGALAAAISVPAPPEDAAVRDSAKALLLKGDLGGFDALATGFRNSRERTASGSWKLGLAYLSVDQDWFPPADPRWEKLQQAAAEWLAGHPDSPTAVAIEARILRARAWAFHDASEGAGDGNASYQQLIEEARRVLDAHPDVKIKDPQWDTLRIAIAREQGADTGQILSMAKRALEREAFYYPLHEAVTNKLMPRWGGSRQAVAQYAQMALAYSSKQEGDQAYARIYYYLARSNRDGDPGIELGEMAVQWPLMQQGMADIVGAYPSAFNHDVQRVLTCFTGREGEMRALGRLDTANFVPVAWWDGAQWRQSCNELAFEGKVQHASLPRLVRGYAAFIGSFGDVFWQRIRLAVLATFLLLEGALALLAMQSGRELAWPGSQGFSETFNPMAYPRSYATAASRDPKFVRLSVWMMLGGGACTYVVAHGDTPDMLVHQTVMAGFVMVSVTGALMIFSRLTARVVLEQDGVRVRALVGGARMSRQDILGVRYYQRGKGPRLIELVARDPAAAALCLPPVRYEDGPFRIWFNSLPALAPPVADDSEIPLSEAVPKAR
jgi:hypothetical protein